MSDVCNTQCASVFGRLLARARGALRDLAARHALRQELLECERSGVLDSVLTDLQMRRDELEPMIENYPLSRRLFGAVAARLGVDPTCDGPSIRRGLQHTCAVCSEQRRCRQWLAAGHTEGYDEFCPNADYWHALQERVRATARRKT